MTATELESILQTVHWRAADLVRALSEAAGRKVRPSTVSDYLTGKAKVPAGVAFAVSLLLAAKEAGFAVPPPEHADGRKTRWVKSEDALAPKPRSRARRTDRAPSRTA